MKRYSFSEALQRPVPLLDGEWVKYEDVKLLYDTLSELYSVYSKDWNRLHKESVAISLQKLREGGE